MQRPLAHSSSATSNADANDTAHVTIQTGSTIIGTNMVDIEARHDNLADYANANSDCAAVFGSAYGTTATNIAGPSSNDSTQPDFTQVDAAAGATVKTPDLLVQALDSFTQKTTNSDDTSGGFIVGHYDNNSGNVAANRTIHWNADVVSLAAGANTVLMVDANGNVLPSSTITPTITSTQIIVPDIGGSIAPAPSLS